MKIVNIFSTKQYYSAIGPIISRYGINALWQIFNFMLLSILLLILSSCDSTPPEGLPSNLPAYASNSNIIENNFNITILPQNSSTAQNNSQTQSNQLQNNSAKGTNGNWYNTNINVSKGMQFAIQVTGIMDLNSNFTTSYIVSAANSANTDTDINNNQNQVQNGDIVYLFLTQIPNPQPSANASNPFGPINMVTNYGSVNEVSTTQLLSNYNQGLTPICSSNTPSATKSKSTTCIPLCYESTGYKDGCIAYNGMGLQVLIGDNLIEEFPNSYFTQMQKLFPLNVITDMDNYQKRNMNDIGVQNFYNMSVQRVFSFQATKSGVLQFMIPDSTRLFSGNMGSYNITVYTDSVNTQVLNGNASPLNGGYPGAVYYAISSEQPDPIPSANSKSISRGVKMLQNGKYSGNAENSGTIWLLLDDNNQPNMSGQYTITTAAVVSPKTMPSLVTTINNNITVPITDLFQAVSGAVFKSFAQSTIFQGVVLLALQLYIIIYAICFLMGIIRASYKDAVIRLMKIAFVLALLQDNSLEFFNTNFFNFFISGMNYLTSTVVGNQGQSSILSFIDVLIGDLLNVNLWLKMLTIIFVGFGSKLGGVGIFVVLYIVFLIVYFCVIYMTIILEAYLGYLMVMVIMFMLIALAPIFIPMILFQVTKDIFLSWVKYLFHLMLQPLLVMTILVIFNSLVMSLIFGMFGWSAEWMSYYTPCIYNPLSKFNMGSSQYCFNGNLLPNLSIYFYGTSENLSQIFYNVVLYSITLIILLKILKQMPTFIMQLSQTLVSGQLGVGGTMVGQGGIGREMYGQVMASVTDKAKWVVGMDRESVDKRKGERARVKADRRAAEVEKIIGGNQNNPQGGGGGQGGVV
jgi:type IV secretory pathway VirB6-like protein